MKSNDSYSGIVNQVWLPIAFILLLFTTNSPALAQNKDAIKACKEVSTITASLGEAELTTFQTIFRGFQAQFYSGCTSFVFIISDKKLFINDKGKMKHQLLVLEGWKSIDSLFKIDGEEFTAAFQKNGVTCLYRNEEPEYSSDIIYVGCTVLPVP